MLQVGERDLWEYCFYFHTRNLGDQVRHVQNPFTGKSIEVPIDPPLAQCEWDAIRDVFKKHHFDGPLPEGEGFRISMTDGQYVGLRLGPTGLAIEIVMRELSNSVIEIMIEIAKAGNLAFTSTTGDKVRLLDGPLDAKTLARWPDATVLHSVSEVKSWLVDDICGRKVRSLIEKPA
jgi:hypothetical protein